MDDRRASRRPTPRWVLGLAATATWWLAACPSSSGPGSLGGESHFLMRCDDSCGSDLDCIQGVCTRGCVVASDSCSDLSEQAVCTADSVEPGEVAICDQSCSAKADCASISEAHVCDKGQCRAPKSSSGGEPDAGGGSPSDGSAGGDANDGSDASDDAMTGSDFPYPTDRVFECPQESIDSDSHFVTRYVMDGDSLELTITHSGGCAEHRYAVCFGPEFAESYPVQTTLRVIHDNGGDMCEAEITNTPSFDLTPLADYYKAAYRTESGLVSTNFGLYAFGPLSCEDRELAAPAQAQAIADQAPNTCTDASDCSWVSIDTACSATCGALVATASAAEVNALLQSVSENVCGDFEGDGCGPVIVPPCVPPPPLDCVGGQCRALE